MSDALTQLMERLGTATDLARISRLLSWDQQTMMPPAGIRHRADHLSMVSRLAHEVLTDKETARLLDELRATEESLDPSSDDAALIRMTRRDYAKAVRVPTDLRAEMTRAAAEARPVWMEAKAESSFEKFLCLPWSARSSCAGVTSSASTGLRSRMTSCWTTSSPERRQPRSVKSSTRSSPS